MAGEITKLRYQKRTAKSSMTRLENYMKELDVDTCEIEDLRIRIAKLDEVYKLFGEVQSELVAKDDTMSEIELETEAEDVENRYIQLKVLAERLIKDKLKSHVNNEIVETYDRVSNNERSRVSTYEKNIRLPKIELPTFAGAYEDWHAFFDMFNSLIHSNQSLNDTQRFHYLKSSLKGDAAEVVSSLEISGNNYADAWSRLRERYDNKRLTVQNHIRAIFDLPVVKKEGSTAIRQVLDGVLKHTRALRALERPTEQWDDLLIHIIASKLDLKTIKEWEGTINSTEVPSFTDFIEFLKKRCQTLEAVEKMGINCASNALSRQSSHHKTKSCNVSTITIKCTYCKGDHHIYQCKDFKSLTVSDRIKHIKSKGLCLNCLRHKHMARDCSSGNCKICSKRHNSILHDENYEFKTEAKPVQEQEVQVKNSDNIVCNHSRSIEIMHSSQILLSTAIVKIKDKDGNFVTARALLDNGSQPNFVTESFAKRLKFSLNETTIQIKGINEQVSKALKVTDLTITSQFNSFTTNLQCVALPTITQRVPNVKVDRKYLDIPKNVRLADPQFHIPSEIDLLIGGEKFWDLICVGQISLGKGKPILRKTLLGWIVAGRLDRKLNISYTSCHLSSVLDLNETLRRFWQIEHPVNDQGSLNEDSYCEEHFVTTYKRNSCGRFVIKLPIKEEIISKIGNSRQIAMKRFLSLERKLNGDLNLKSEYIKFMREYENSGHMKIINDEQEKGLRVFLPHHPIIKESSSTTKVRVVFDASSKDDKGFSLNDALYKGPIIQPDLFTILLRFRCFKYVLSADITKMYRQILVHKEDTSLQTILWRENSCEPVKLYELVTLTYGTKPASYIAVKCLHQLVEEEGARFSMASRVIKQDFYMDDLLTGADNVDDLMQIKTQVTELLKLAGLELHKWKSNILECSEASSCNFLDFVDSVNENDTRLLGIRWNPNKDTLHFTIPMNKGCKRVTKRAILSEISRLFDPLGLVGPVITFAKILMQNLWAWRIGWDDDVPTQVRNSWVLFRSQLVALQSIEVPRLMIAEHQINQIQLHGFSDASEQAYGACIYIVCEGSNGETSTALVCSKSRVAPLKVLSLPRLELCGALLLTRLMKRVMADLNVTVHKRFFWTDSKIVLAWLGAPAKRWHTFVANRISEIQDNSSPCEWGHIRSKENPADLISRGTNPEKLRHSSLWWKGPQWLKSKNQFPVCDSDLLIIKDMPEARKEAIVMTIQTRESVIQIERFSTLSKLLRVAAYVLRFIYNLRCDSGMRKTGYISLLELKNARDMIVKSVQLEIWKVDIERLCNNKEVLKESKLASLNPYLDSKGLIRVTGRLNKSSLTEDAKHPAIIPASHHFTRLIIIDKHERLFHAGVNATLAAIREEYWPISAKNEVKKYLRNCVVCAKSRPIPSTHLMGQLPHSRVNISRPFSHVGVDYCGSILVRDRIRRNSKQYKAYIAIFVCMVIKAVHIELVEDMTAAAFIGCLKRFIARRGIPSDIYSDNGRNFIGADNEIEHLFQDPEFKRRVHDASTKEGINWHFIPPRSPHHGGLWEAAVKSMKGHLKRTIGNASLTITEMITVLSEIEAILNSRPLAPLSDDPKDLEVLTPSHFLIGCPMTSLPQPNILEVPIPRLSRWQHVEQMRQRFWSRWSKEYLNTCQLRSKWRHDKGTSFKIGQLVMLKEDDCKPCQWVMARIIDEHPGDDGILRIVTVRTAKGSYKRPVVKLSPIPCE